MKMNTNSMMCWWSRKLGSAVTLGSLVLGLGLPLQAAETSPNFILILTDDHGWTSTSSPMDKSLPTSASDYQETPNIDRLAREGMRFSQGYPPTASVHGGVYHWEFRGQWVARDGRWKLLGNPVDQSAKTPLGENDKLFLVDLDNDPGELTNLASRYPQKVETLKQSYLTWKNSF